MWNMADGTWSCPNSWRISRLRCFRAALRHHFKTCLHASLLCKLFCYTINILWFAFSSDFLVIKHIFYTQIGGRGKRAGRERRQIKEAIDCSHLWWFWCCEITNLNFRPAISYKYVRQLRFLLWYHKGYESQQLCLHLHLLFWVVNRPIGRKSSVI